MSEAAVWLFTACGLALLGIGGFFMTVRPALLPEDARFMGSTSRQILEAVPGLRVWLRRVFWVLGSFVVTTGILVVFVAQTGLRAGDPGALVVLAIAGVTSVGWMTAVNFMIGSDFRWALLGLAGVWATGVALAAAG